jgi:hypothetical protein
MRPVPVNDLKRSASQRELRVIQCAEESAQPLPYPPLWRRQTCRKLGSETVLLAENP